MKLIVPDYYQEFHCIAGRCRHSCCIGWEIDIDPETMETYRQLEGPFGARLINAIEETEGIPHFRLCENERCPMLNENGLCDLITELSEDHLCQICADHPRFRNFFSHRTEMGLGLCCEEAARLILTRKEPMRLITLEDDGLLETPSPEEEALLTLRDTCISIMQNGELPLAERLQKLLDTAKISIPCCNWRQVYSSLERLDDGWTEMLLTLPDEESELVFSEICCDPIQSMLTNFAVYLLFRHLPGVLDDGLYAGRIAFCVLSVRLLYALCMAQDGRPETLLNLARMYSAEIEYSEENIIALLDILEPEFPL